MKSWLSNAMLRARPAPHQLRRLWYVPLLSSAMALMLARMFVLAKILSVSAFAAFSKGTLVSTTFTMLGCLGLQALLQRELPVQFVRGRETAGHVLLAQCVIVAVACAIVGQVLALLGLAAPAIPAWIVSIGVLHGLSQQLFLVATVDSRSRGDPLRFARQSLVRGALVFVASATVASATHSAGWTLAAEATLSIFLSQVALRETWVRRSRPVAAVFILALRRLGHIKWSVALALLAVALVTFVGLSADRWIAARALPQDAFALYAFAGTVLLVAQALQLVVNASVYPYLARQFARQGSGTAFRLCVRVSLGLLVVGALLVAPAIWVADFFVHRWFVSYIGALAIMPLFMYVSVLRLSDFWSSYLIIVGAERRLLLVNIIAIIVGAGGWVAWFWPMESIALAPLQIAELAAALAVSAYAGGAIAAWRAFRARRAGPASG